MRYIRAYMLRLLIFTENEISRARSFSLSGKMCFVLVFSAAYTERYTHIRRSLKIRPGVVVSRRVKSNLPVCPVSRTRVTLID